MVCSQSPREWRGYTSRDLSVTQGKLSTNSSRRVLYNNSDLFSPGCGTSYALNLSVDGSGISARQADVDKAVLCTWDVGDPGKLVIGICTNALYGESALVLNMTTPILLQRGG